MVLLNCSVISVLGHPHHAPSMPSDRSRGGFPEPVPHDPFSSRRLRLNPGLLPVLAI